jgi:hypothetical protein
MQEVSTLQAAAAGAMKLSTVWISSERASSGMCQMPSWWAIRLRNFCSRLNGLPLRQGTVRRVGGRRPRGRATGWSCTGGPSRKRQKPELSSAMTSAMRGSRALGPGRCRRGLAAQTHLPVEVPLGGAPESSRCEPKSYRHADASLRSGWRASTLAGHVVAVGYDAGSGSAHDAATRDGAQRCASGGGREVRVCVT